MILCLTLPTIFHEPIKLELVIDIRTSKNNYASLRIFADPAYASLQRSAKTV